MSTIVSTERSEPEVAAGGENIPSGVSGAACAFVTLLALLYSNPTSEFKLPVSFPRPSSIYDLFCRDADYADQLLIRKGPDFIPRIFLVVMKTWSQSNIYERAGTRTLVQRTFVPREQY